MKWNITKTYGNDVIIQRKLYRIKAGIEYRNIFCRSKSFADDSICRFEQWAEMKNYFERDTYVKLLKTKRDHDKLMIIINYYERDTDMNKCFEIGTDVNNNSERDMDVKNYF